MSEIYLPKHLRNATIGADTMVYFERISDGNLILAVMPSHPVPYGYVRREADHAHDIERISKRYEKQIQAEFALIDERRCKIIETKHAEIRANLHAAMHSASTSPLGKEIIRLALIKLEEREKGLRQRRVEGHLLIEA